MQHELRGVLVDFFFEQPVLRLLVLFRILDFDLLVPRVQQNELLEWRVLQHLHDFRLDFDGEPLDSVEFESLHRLVVFDAERVLQETHHVLLFLLALSLLVQVQLQLLDAVH